MQNSIFYFKPETPFLGKFGPKHQIWSIKKEEIWEIDLFEYVNFEGDVRLSWKSFSYAELLVDELYWIR